MQTLVRVAVVLGALGLVAATSAATEITLENVNLVAAKPAQPGPPPIAATPETVQPEGLLYIGQGVTRKGLLWQIVVVYGKINEGIFVPFGDTETTTISVTAPTPVTGTSWKVPNPVATKATWTSQYFCRATVQSSRDNGASWSYEGSVVKLVK